LALAFIGFGVRWRWRSLALASVLTGLDKRQLVGDMGKQHTYYHLSTKNPYIRVDWHWPEAVCWHWRWLSVHVGMRWHGRWHSLALTRPLAYAALTWQLVPVDDSYPLAVMWPSVWD